MTYAVDLSNLALEANGAAAGITANTTAISAISVGNSTVNSTINATALAIGNSTVNSSINAIALSIGSNVAAFGTTFYSVANGNVGIQTSLPDAHFHISSGSAKVRIGLTTSNQYIDISRDSPTGFTIYNAAQASPYAGHIWQVTSTEYMRITSNGNVGIGTNTPSNTLSVTGTAGISGALTVNGAISTGNTNLGNNQVATVAFAIAAAIAF